MEVTISSFAKIAGTTVRTLRYYDKIGLLSPENKNHKGNKVYTTVDWENFQKIKIYKHLGLSLEEIKEQMKNRGIKNRELLLIQKQFILKKQEELNDVIEMITRMERLYNQENISEEELKELDEFSFIMLDLFRLEKTQIQALEKHFEEDKEVLNEIKVFHDPEFKKKMDQNLWHLLQAINRSIEHNDSTSKNKVQEMIREIDNLYPAMKRFLSIGWDDEFLARHHHEFTFYFPEDIAVYIYEELKTYYTE
ncbi:MerR family transcriptional regulator [Salibacterium aidingense]|uniref:MerR family transcriptional regulator n=1 Tax=Salibacterium aidingense TaxID=384933 RepID=UPI000408616C|nr:MerR family transcriptional regulator [Salibacterium aidingense]